MSGDDDVETNCSQKVIDMSYRESMMCKWKLGYRDSKVGCSKIMLDYKQEDLLLLL